MKRLATILSLLLFVPSLTFAATTFDNSCTNTTSNSSTPSTCTFTIAAGATMAIACPLNGGSTNNANITSVTDGAGSFTKRADIGGVAGQVNALSCWTLFNPPSGSVTINVNFSSGSIRGFWVESLLGSGDYEGVSNAQFTTTGNLVATSSAIIAGSWTTMAFESNGNTPTASTGTTGRGTSFAASSFGDSGGVVSSTSMGWTSTNNNGNYALVVIAAAASPVYVPNTQICVSLYCFYQ